MAYKTQTPSGPTSASSAPALPAPPPPRCFAKPASRSWPWRKARGGSAKASAATNSPTSTATISGPTRSSIRAPARAPPTRRRASRCSARCRRWSAAARSTGRAGCRASPRTISACAPWPATCRAPRSPTGRSPMTISSPTTRKVEWAFGVSGPGRRQQVRSSAQPGGYPCPPMPMSRYAQKFTRVAARSAGTPSRRRRRRCRARSTAARRQ